MPIGKTFQRASAVASSYILEPKKRRILLLWLLLLCIAPFAIEIVFLADLIGIELAMSFLFYYAKSLYFSVYQRWLDFRGLCSESLKAIANHSVSEPKIFCVNACYSAILFLVTGSSVWALLAWYPVVVFGFQSSPLG